MKTKKRSWMGAIMGMSFFLLIVSAMAVNAQQNRNNQGEMEEVGHSYNQHGESHNNNQTMGRSFREPPREAINACKGKKSGDNVEFSTPHGNRVKGTCVKNGDLLFAAPQGGHPSSRGGRR